MINRNKAQRILWYETIGFLCLVALTWLDELVNLPHLLFRSGEHSSLHEAMMETGALLLVWLAVIFFTSRLLKRLYYLEGFLRVCAWCRKIGHENDWKTVEQLFAQGFDMKTSHGMCPACQKKWLARDKLEAA